MKPINITHVKWMTAILILTTMIGCSPKIDSSLFYRYREDNGDYFWFNGKRYSIYVSEWEIYNLPIPVKKYLLKSNLANKERITELFYKYNGTIKLEGFSKFDIKKHYRINEHCSGLEPRFLSEGKSFPVKATIELNQEATIQAKSIGIELLKDENIKSLATDDLCVLKYLAQMVWYPSAYLNENIRWDPVLKDSIIDKNSTMLTIQEKNLQAVGQLIFDSVSSMPVSFIGKISKNVDFQYSMAKFEISYSNFKDTDLYNLPQKCMAKIEDEEQREIVIEMKLGKYKQPDQEMMMKSEKKKEKN